MASSRGSRAEAHRCKISVLFVQFTRIAQFRSENASVVPSKMQGQLNFSRVNGYIFWHKTTYIDHKS